MISVKLVFLDGRQNDKPAVELEMGPFNQGVMIAENEKGFTELIDVAFRRPIAYQSSLGGWLTYAGDDRREWPEVHVCAVM